MRVSPFTPAEEGLRLSSAQRDLTGMERTSAPLGPNAFDTGTASKPAAENNQEFNNMRYAQQSYEQNAGTQVSQAGADAAINSRKQTLVTANSENKANQLMVARKSEMLEALGAQAVASMGNMTPPELQKLRSDRATMQAMTLGVNPELVLNQVQSPIA